MNRTTLFASSVLLASTLTLAGCGGAQRIDPAGPKTITTVSNLDIQDASDAAGKLSESLLASGILGQGGKPSVIAVDRFVNNTSEQIDRDIVMKKIRVTLNKAGVAQTMTTIDSAGNVGGESQIASKAKQGQIDNARADEFLGNENRSQVRLYPDYALTFKILDNRVRAGDVRQTSYIFQMSLTDVNNGLAVWEEEYTLTKQGKRPSVGW